MLLPHLIKNVNYGRSKVAEETAQKLEDDANNFIKVVDEFLKAAEDLGQSSKFNVTGMVEAFNKKHNSTIQKLDFLSFRQIEFVEQLSLNWSNQLSKKTNKSEILKAPRGKMPDVIQMAEKIGLVIIPNEFVNYEIVRNAPSPHPDCINRYMGNVYTNFVKLADAEGLRAWVVCPVSYYSIEQHAKNMVFESFIPTHIQQAFTSIKIILPMLVGMINQIDKLSSQVQSLSNTYNGVKETLEAQQQQINRLAGDLDTIRRQKIRQEATYRDSIYGSNWWTSRPYQSSIASSFTDFWSFDNRLEGGYCDDWFEDPLLIAAPKSVTDINKYTGSVVLGPTWGADIDPLLVDLLGLEEVPGRKHYVVNEFNRYAR